MPPVQAGLQVPPLPEEEPELPELEPPWQLPFTQALPPRQLFPQSPQLWLSLDRSAQAAGVSELSWQQVDATPVQATPQPPQLAVVLMSTQLPWQQVDPAAPSTPQLLPHSPQLWMSLDRSAQDAGALGASWQHVDSAPSQLESQPPQVAGVFKLVHVPWQHPSDCAALHAMPHPPQLLPSLEMSVQAPPQHDSPLLHSGSQAVPVSSAGPKSEKWLTCACTWVESATVVGRAV
jgi:hypothetical protein